MLRADDHADGNFSLQRNPPAPAVIQPRGVDVAFKVEFGRVNVREERGVLASAFARRDAEQFRQQPQTAGGIHDQIRLVGTPVSDPAR